jgi:alkanesulfonate monooxygenase SsuD/methylene tetrahydromethanopterin reductase-like flavin-dependent oxidoreductase (luciferase family)
MHVRGRPLHFGVQLQAQGTTWADYARGVQAVEELGFGSVWTFDHLLPFVGPDDRPCFETLTTLGAMAVLTSRARIGVLVNGVLYRPPALLAKAAAQVDEMSGGRLDFSLGAAWAEREFKAYGLDFPPLAERYARLDEALQLVKLLWAQDRTTFRGRFYQVEEAPCDPKPVQSPHPPITIGGAGLGSLRIAAAHADRLNVVGPAAKCAERISKLEKLCAETGRNFNEIELSAHPNIAVAATADQAEALARKAAAANSQDLETQRGNWLIGTPPDVVEDLQGYMAVGVSHFVFAAGHPFDLAPLRLLQQEVLPALTA